MHFKVPYLFPYFMILLKIIALCEAIFHYYGFYSINKLFYDIFIVLWENMKVRCQQLAHRLITVSPIISPVSIELRYQLNREVT